MKRTVPLAATLLLLSSVTAAQAQAPAKAPPPRLVAGSTLDAGSLWLEASLERAEGRAFRLWITPDDPARVARPRRFSLGTYPLDALGAGLARVPLPPNLPALWPDGWFVAATVWGGGAPVFVPEVPAEEPIGGPWDLDWGLGGVPQLAGTVVSTVQPWGGFATITARNGNPAHPDACILLDSANPAVGEEDLATPGAGAGNTVPRGMVLVIAEDVADGNGDGLVDEPHAEPAGGTLVFDFPGPSTVGDIWLVDVDEPGTEVRLHYPGSSFTIPVPVGASNGVQTVFGGFGVVRVEIELTGKAAVAQLQINPCLATFDFDHTVTGIPLGFAAGTDFFTTNAHQGQLIYFDAENAAPGHPDKGILFDTASWTGGDFDLQTPGYGVGNTEAHGMVLVIAENDVDADGDGLVGVPDDEALGGTLSLNYYTSDAFFRGATVVDVDEDEVAWIEVHLNRGGTEVIPLQSLGDNSVQRVTANAGPTRRVTFHFSGSGAVADVTVCPDF